MDKDQIQVHLHLICYSPTFFSFLTLPPSSSSLLSRPKYKSLQKTMQKWTRTRSRSIFISLATRPQRMNTKCSESPGTEAGQGPLALTLSLFCPLSLSLTHTHTQTHTLSLLVFVAVSHTLGCEGFFDQIPAKAVGISVGSAHVPMVGPAYVPTGLCTFPEAFPTTLF